MKTESKEKISDGDKLPPCGLYRTGHPLAQDPEAIPAGILVMFHNHSDQNMPMLQLPKENKRNVWSFHQYGPGIENDDAFIEALQPLRPQGLYFLKTALQTPDGDYPAHTLVQLGYNRDGNPILFVANRHPVQNSLSFADEGYRFDSLNIFDKLGPNEPILWADADSSAEKAYLH